MAPLPIDKVSSDNSPYQTRINQTRHLGHTRTSADTVSGPCLLIVMNTMVLFTCPEGQGSMSRAGREDSWGVTGTLVRACPVPSDRTNLG